LLLVTFDTLRADFCGFQGGLKEWTPTLNSFANSGVVFEQAYAMSATTAPSHATLFTGRYPSEHGVVMNGLNLPEDEITLAEVLQDAGYRSAAFVSSFTVRERFGYHQGFDLIDDDFDTAEGVREAKNSVHAGEKLTGYLDRSGMDTAARAARWIQAQDTARPWVVWVHFFDPHAPYAPPEPFASRFASVAADADENTRNRALYAADVAYTDAAFAELVTAVREQEGPAGTLVALTSDHGEMLGEHDWTGHGIYLYEKSMHVPWVFHHPDLPASRMAAPIGHIEFAQTTLGLLGVTPPAAMRGRDLSETLRAGQDPQAQAIVMRRRDYDSAEVNGIPVSGSQWAYRKGNWKLIYSAESSHAELYQLKDDPAELHDLALEQDRLTGQLIVELEEFLASLNRRAEQQERSEEDLQALEQLGYVR